MFGCVTADSKELWDKVAWHFSLGMFLAWVLFAALQGRSTSSTQEQNQLLVSLSMSVKVRRKRRMKLKIPNRRSCRRGVQSRLQPSWMNLKRLIVHWRSGVRCTVKSCDAQGSIKNQTLNEYTCWCLYCCYMLCIATTDFTCSCLSCSRLLDANALTSTLILGTSPPSVANPPDLK